jgi:hypothetical protein
MAEWVVAGAVIQFDPGMGWSWSGWNGRLELDVPDRGLTCDSHPVGIAEDICRMASKLRSKSYRAAGFSDTEETVLNASISVNTESLDEATTCDGKSIVLSSSEGTFEVACTPSLKAGSPPIPDPNPVGKRGRWFVEQSGQDSATSG